MGGSSSPLPSPIKKAVNTVADTVVSVVKNPLPVIETAVLSAAGVPAPAASAIVSYANGGSLKDAATSAASSYVGGQAAEQLGAPATYGTDVGSQQSQMLAAQEVGIPTVEKSAIGGAAAGATKAAATGKSIAEGALKGGLVSGGSEYISESAGMQPGSTGEFLTKTLAGSTLSNIVGGKQSPSTYVPSGGAAPTSVTTTGAGASPGTAALAQALRTDLGAPIFGGDKDKESPKSGWNVESLRYTGGTGEA